MKRNIWDKLKWPYLVVALFIAQGCATSGYKKFYNQVSPHKYPPPDKLVVFEYENVNLDDIYERFFNDFLIIGKSSFNGSYNKPLFAGRFAESIGADVFITTSQLKEKQTTFMTIGLPSTTQISGYSGGGSFYGTATNYGISSLSVPITVNLYAQNGIFLRNVNNVVPLWKRTKDQYTKTDKNDIEGTWFNEVYEIEVFQSGTQIVCFLVSEPNIEKQLVPKTVFRYRTKWDIGQLKMIFGVDSAVGLYLMRDKTPMPAKFQVNKFGHLEASFILEDSTVSFARKE